MIDGMRSGFTPSGRIELVKAAAVLGISEPTLRRRVAAGEFVDWTRVNGHTWLSQSEVAAYAAALEAGVEVRDRRTLTKAEGRLANTWNDRVGPSKGHERESA
jgi:hypothetical protein